MDSDNVKDDWEDDEQVGDLYCPNCGHEYDEIDYEYQICHICGFNNNPPQNKSVK